VSLLGRPWTLREVEDVEGLARGILERQLAKLGARLRPDLLDEAVCFLLEVAVRADRSYEPARGAWEPYLRWKLGVGVVDFYRKELGRTRWQFSDSTHERERPDLLSFDGPGIGGELDGALAHEQGEFEAGVIDLRGVLAG
jgi:hypothetical protein